MEHRTGKYWLQKLVLSAVLAGEGMLLADAVVVFLGKTIHETVFAALCGILTLVLFFLSRLTVRRLKILTVAVPLVLALLVGSGYGCWRSFSKNADYRVPASDKSSIYGNRKVMLVVPHEDDDLNILGGVLEEYVRYGSEVYAVFVTNGDYVFAAETRYQEAIAALGNIGIPEDHLIFLGYGDSWEEGGPHIYNAPEGKTMTSQAGRQITYGIPSHSAWREGREYTIDNLTQDLKDVILTYRPDVLFCTDYDHHIDHKAVTLLFDKVMGTILKEQPSYRPVVYKGYAYSTAWEAEPDYFEDNILSTKNVFGEGYDQQPTVYRWEDRVRLPVAGENLSRSLLGSSGYETLALYKTQGASVRAARMINGDKVFWQRHTDSLCHDAQITVSSGNSALLNDFMLIENRNLVDEGRAPYDGVWSPEDAGKRVTVQLSAPSDVAVIRLYDHPSPDVNVRNAEILFDDGIHLQTGPLDPGGAATEIRVNKTGVTSFEIVLTETEGDAPGLTEVEAFANLPGREGAFLKLMDGEENFAYDYRTGKDGIAVFYPYVHGAAAAQGVTVRLDNSHCKAEWDGTRIWVECPEGERCSLTVTDGAQGISDSITVSNPEMGDRLWADLWQKVEKELYLRYSNNHQENLFPVRLFNWIKHFMKH